MSAFFSDMGLFWDLLIPGLLLGLIMAGGAALLYWFAYSVDEAEDEQ